MRLSCQSPLEILSSISPVPAIRAKANERQKSYACEDFKKHEIVPIRVGWKTLYSHATRCILLSERNRQMSAFELIVYSPTAEETQEKSGISRLNINGILGPILAVYFQVIHRQAGNNSKLGGCYLGTSFQREAANSCASTW